MQFGIFFEHQVPRPWADGKELQQFQGALDQVQLADEIGIAYAWAQEHHFLEEYSHSTCPEVFLGAASQRSRRIRLGQGVALMAPGYNPPVRVAERLATLDLVSGGRVDWGTGESSSRLELEGFRLPYLEKRAMWLEGLRETIRMLCLEPYPGFQGEYFSMPARNIVPKPIQRPHPPLWMACSNRDSLRRAARIGVGALTFAFMNAKEARFWVEEYYETFERECVPIGQTVNPNIAVLSGFMCLEDAEVARERALEGLAFFAFGLSHYLRTGSHVPGSTDLWRAFQGAARGPIAGSDGIGSPDQVRRHFEDLEQAGVDQVILLQQSGGYRQEDIMTSLQLFGKQVLPAFIERQESLAAAKTARLAGAIERALERKPVLQPATDVETVEAYPVSLEKQGVQASGIALNRSGDAAALWRLHASGTSTRTRS